MVAFIWDDMRLAFHGNFTNSTANYGQIANTELTLPVVVQGVRVWNKIPWDSTYTRGQTNSLYGSWDNPGAAKVSRNLYSDSNSVVSHLIYDVEYDAALKFVSEIDAAYITYSRDKGWYSNNKKYNTNHLTGLNIEADINGDGVNEVGTNRLNNIYDMGGNVFEWTQGVEWRGSDSAPDTPSYDRIVRTGSYNRIVQPSLNEASAGHRRSMGPSTSLSELGFRIALYLI